MISTKKQSRTKIMSAVQAVDRTISKVEREVRKADPESQSYQRHVQELAKLRQKRARLIQGVSHS